MTKHLSSKRSNLILNVKVYTGKSRTMLNALCSIYWYNELLSLKLNAKITSRYDYERKYRTTSNDL